jgi:hypothetical protein
MEVSYLFSPTGPAAIARAVREHEKAVREGTLGQGDSDGDDLYRADKEGDERIVIMYVRQTRAYLSDGNTACRAAMPYMEV